MLERIQKVRHFLASFQKNFISDLRPPPIHNIAKTCQSRWSYDVVTLELPINQGLMMWLHWNHQVEKYHQNRLHVQKVIRGVRGLLVVWGRIWMGTFEKMPRSV